MKRWAIDHWTRWEISFECSEIIGVDEIPLDHRIFSTGEKKKSMTDIYEDVRFPLSTKV